MESRKRRPEEDESDSNKKPRPSTNEHDFPPECFPSQDELNDNSGALPLKKLFALSEMKFEYGVDFTVDATRNTKKFIQFTEEGVQKMRQYELDTVFGFGKLTSDRCETFMRGLSGTKLMKYLYLYGKQKFGLKYYSKEFSTYQTFLKWFTFVWMGTGLFAHVFFGVIEDDKVKGMHNLLRLYFLQEKGKISFINSPKVNDSEKPLLANITFRVDARGKSFRKDISTFFIGTSPLLEISIYTLAILLDGDYHEFFFDGCRFRVKLKYADDYTLIPETIFPMVHIQKRKNVTNRATK